MLANLNIFDFWLLLKIFWRFYCLLQPLHEEISKHKTLTNLLHRDGTVHTGQYIIIYWQSQSIDTLGMNNVQQHQQPTNQFIFGQMRFFSSIPSKHKWEETVELTCIKRYFRIEKEEGVSMQGNLWSVQLTLFMKGPSSFHFFLIKTWHKFKHNVLQRFVHSHTSQRSSFVDDNFTDRTFCTLWCSSLYVINDASFADCNKQQETLDIKEQYICI